jgi:hypothetical protein
VGRTRKPTDAELLAARALRERREKKTAKQLLDALLRSLADRAGVAWTAEDTECVDKIFDVLEEEVSKSVEQQLVGNGLIEDF